MGTPELIVEKRYFITQLERGLHALVGRIGAINGRNSDVSIADPPRNIETKRASPARVRAAEADSNIHIRNRTARHPTRGQSCINKSRYSGPEWASTPPSLHFC